MTEWYMVTFRSTYSAMNMQSKIRGKVPFVTMPVLREISASCGIAIRVEKADINLLSTPNLLSGMECDEFEIYLISQDDNEIKYNKIT